jgi:hypothetical protein
MFFLLVVALFVFAAIGVGSILGPGLAWLVLLPILMLKVAFLLMLFGFVGRRVWSTRRMWEWDEPQWRGRSRPRRRPEVPTTRSDEDRFAEWHRIAHAREEVDGWVSDLGEIEQD